MVKIELNRRELLHILAKMDRGLLSDEEEDILFDKLIEAKDKAPGGWAGGKDEPQIKAKRKA